MGGGDGGHGACPQVCPYQLDAGEQHEERAIQDFPHPVAVGREAQNKLSLRNRDPECESAEVGKDFGVVVGGCWVVFFVTRAPGR